MDLKEIQIEVPEGFQLILGQSHFIKTVEDIFETLATSMPGIKFGVAFCEASGKALVRFDGNDQIATELAKSVASKIGAGHAFVVILNGSFPLNVLNRIKDVEEVASVYCATANSVSVIALDTASGRAILGVADGIRSKGVEAESDKTDRHDFLRKIGYKR